MKRAFDFDFEFYSSRLLPAAAVLSLCAAGCGDDPATKADISDDGDAIGDVGDGTDTTPDGTNDGTNDGTTAETDATRPDGEVIVPPEGCDEPIPAAPAGELCTVTSGSTSALLIRADLVMPGGLLERGALLIENGLISCAGCDCLTGPAAAGATVFACPDAVVSPGLINAHDHITFSQGKPPGHGDVRYDHRHEWRKGSAGKPKIPSPSNDSPLGDSWVELRQVLAGTTSYFASGAAPGLVRNLDTASRLEGLNHGAADYETFPLGDTGGGIINSGCAYDKKPALSVLDAVAWVPHVAEGVNVGARNEELCLDGQQEGGVDVVADNTGFIHAVGTTAADIAIFVGEGAGLVWSPRSNTDLYGFTAFAPLFHRFGGQIALGTDWTYTGSINILRELQCAEDWNARWDNYFSDAQLVAMVTSWGATNLGFSDVLGSLTPGKLADIAIWDARGHEGYRAILDAEVSDVALVLRGGAPPTIGGTTYFRRGRPLYGDSALVNALAERQLDYANYDPNVYSATDASKKKLAACETITVCAVDKTLCLAEQLEQKPAGASFFQTYTYAELKAQLDPSKTYDAFFCGVPTGEPSCVPARPGEFDGVGGVSDDDGDGVPNGEDNCPGWFNGIRPLDNGRQPDTDGDGEGDVCDVCPFDADTTACTSVNPDDVDGDGFLNDADKCPSLPDDQADSDSDGIGNACDECPDFPNVGGAGCPSTIIAVKKAEVAAGKSVSLPNVVVVSVGSDFYTIQMPGPAQEFGGLYVFVGSDGQKPTAGQWVAVQGRVDDYFGQIRLADSTFTVLPTAGTIPEPLVIAPADTAQGGAKEKAYEALLVEVQDVTVIDITPTASVNGTATENVVGEFVVTGDLRVDDAIYAITPAPVEGQTFPVLRGVLRLAWNRNKLLPRSEADVTSGPPLLLGFAEPTVSLYAGTTSSVQVSLSGDATQASVITLTSATPGVATVPASVTIPIGTKSASVVVTGVAQGTARITASYDDGTGVISRELTATVFAANAQPKVVSLEASSESVLLGGSTTLTVTLDLPARTGGTPVAISSTGVALVLPGAQVVVPEGMNSVDFDVDAGNVTGAATVKAAAGGAEATAALTVVEAPLIGLILAEVYYNPTGADGGQEWVKVYNGSNAAISLAGYSLAWRGADFTNGGGTLQLTGSVPAGKCFIIGGPTANFGIGAYDMVNDFTPDIQNAGVDADEALDGVALYKVAATAVTVTTTPVDVVAWGAVNTNNILGPNGPLTTGNAPVVNGKSVRRKTLALWEEATPSADCIVITQ